MSDLSLGDLRELAERLALGDGDGPYITDERRLYRLVDVDDNRNFVMEDCSSPPDRPSYMTVGVITLYQLFRRVDPGGAPDTSE